MKISNQIAVSGFLLLIFMVALWCVDISVSALLSGGHLTNGFFNSNPMIMYHVGVYIAVISMFSLFLILINASIKEEKENEQQKEKGE